MERKETPDVLGAILSGAAEARADLPGLAELPAAPSPRRPRNKATKPEAQPRPGPASAAPQPRPERWEYLAVSLQEHRGWRPRYINGQEIRNWTQAPVIHEYLEELGEDNWELVAAASGKALYGSSDTYQLFFKRAKR
ncbi:MAG: DUF4177 domain-containing protein [Caldilineales bacterium]|nr:DUF4177 domain-containing protein [Caldilineales bacterium]MDW8319488.1 DUF4177 domain-containing protein [Anaerolineae bacterium]